MTNFYLNTPLPNYKYVRLCLDIIPEEIILAYNLRTIVDPDRWVYIKIMNGMYGLPLASILANNLLEQQLSTRGYYQCQHTLGLWRHMWRAITFCLVVGNFGIKVTDIADFNHLKMALEENYKVTIDWTGLLFCGIKFLRDYEQCHVDCSMPGYIDKALKKYQHFKLTAPQDAPYTTAPVQYSTKVQRVKTNTTSALSPAELKQVQDSVGTLLYYTQAVDPTLLAALSAITVQQSNGTQAVAKACNQLLDYVVTHPNAGLGYHACDMILAVYTDAPYLSKAGGKNRVAGHFYLTNQNNKNLDNGAVLTLSAIIKHAMSSTSKAGLSALYYGCKMAAPLRTTLKELGHNQANPTPITTNYITVQGLTMGTMTAKASKSMGQRFHWLKCCDAQHQFKYPWQKGILNQADYASKHHTPKHHKCVCPFYVFDCNTTPAQ